MVYLAVDLFLIVPAGRAEARRYRWRFFESREMIRCALWGGKTLRDLEWEDDAARCGGKTMR